jgi:probable rRNA maturation factor
MRPKHEPKVKFHYQDVSFPFRQRNLLKQFILWVFKKEGRGVSAVNYIFCTDEYLFQLNQSYLGHDTYTDIITFDLAGPGEPVVADIYISVNRVAENAKSFHTAFQSELLRVIFHGVLHLCGYKDKTKKDIHAMRSAEDRLISRFVSRGTKRPKD